MALEPLNCIRLARIDDIRPEGGPLHVLQHSGCSCPEPVNVFTVMTSPMSLMLATQSATWEIARKYLGIRDDVVWISFFAPVAPMSQSNGARGGGFLYFDHDRKLTAVAAITAEWNLRHSLHFLEFHSPVRKSPQSIRSLLDKRDRWSEVSNPEFLRGGARWFTWVCPGEVPEAGGYGGFLYEFASYEYALFPVRVPN